MTKILALAAAAGMMFAASSASAQAVKVTNVAFTPGSVTGNVHSASLNGDVGVGQFEFKGNYVSNNAAFDILTYCIDLGHTVSLGNVNYTSYSVIPIASYTGMTTAKSNALNALLVNTKGLLAAATGQNAIDISAATQMAVWEIMFETQSTWSVTANSAFYITTPGGSSSQNLTALTNAQSLANGYLNNVKNNTWTTNNAYTLKVLYSASQQSQVFLDATAVPEPATWGMLLVGFGLVGGALRQRRGKAGVVATA